MKINVCGNSWSDVSNVREEIFDKEISSSSMRNLISFIWSAKRFRGNEELKKMFDLKFSIVIVNIQIYNRYCCVILLIRRTLLSRFYYKLSIVVLIQDLFSLMTIPNLVSGVGASCQ
ncbi:hypothetical protein CHUAL_007093 [Chamberlinius hualienensis]